jgi:hypothetical protein
MADNRAKAVLASLVDTWSRGARIFPLFTNLGPVVNPGEAVDVPSDGSVTVASTESSAVETVSTTANTMTVNLTRFINRALGHLEAKQLLNGRAQPELMRAQMGALWNAIEAEVITYLIGVAATAGPTAHVNLDGGAVTDGDAAAVEQKLREQDGYGDDSRFAILASPAAVTGLRGVAEYFGGLAPGGAGELGARTPKQVNGIPMIQHAGVPGGTNKTSTATSAVTVSSLVATATVTDTSKFVVGQLVTTTGLTTNDVATPVLAINSATELTYTTAAGDGAMADGAGTISSATGLALFIDGGKIYHAMAGLVPEPSIVKREANAGHALQLIAHFGRAAQAGAVKVLHTPLA